MRINRRTVVSAKAHPKTGKPRIWVSEKYRAGPKPELQTHEMVLELVRLKKEMPHDMRTHKLHSIIGAALSGKSPPTKKRMEALIRQARIHVPK